MTNFGKQKDIDNQSPENSDYSDDEFEDVKIEAYLNLTKIISSAKGIAVYIEPIKLNNPTSFELIFTNPKSLQIKDVDYFKIISVSLKSIFKDNGNLLSFNQANNKFTINSNAYGEFIFQDEETALSLKEKFDSIYKELKLEALRKNLEGKWTSKIKAQRLSLSNKENLAPINEENHNLIYKSNNSKALNNSEAKRSAIGI